jgi:hypothetical protein
LQNGVVDLSRSLLQAGPNVCGLQIGEIFQDLGLTSATGEHFEHVFNANTHPPYARTTAALFEINRDAIQVAHKMNLTDVPVIINPSFPDLGTRESCLHGRDSFFFKVLFSLLTEGGKPRFADKSAGSAISSYSKNPSHGLMAFQEVMFYALSSRRTPCDDGEQTACSISPSHGV